MSEQPPHRRLAGPGEILPPETGSTTIAGATPSGEAALAAAQAFAGRATAAATLRAYKADWTHFSQWCATYGFVPVPAAPATIGAYLASLAESHAPSSIRRRLSALGKMHRFNDLPWNPGHRDIQGPLQGLLRSHGRPARPAAALSLARHVTGASLLLQARAIAAADSDIGTTGDGPQAGRRPGSKSHSSSAGVVQRRSAGTRSI